MDYKKVFYNKSDQEIIEILESYKESTNYDSKVALLQLIEERNILDKTDPSIQTVQKSLYDEESRIHEFIYLPNLGFKIKMEGNTLRVVRTKSAKLIDIFGVILGLLFSLLFILAFQNWREIYNNELEVMPLVGAMILSILGGFGIVLLYKCLMRFFEYLGFEILRDSTGLRISKSTDFKRQTMEISKENLFVESNAGSVSLVCKLEGNESVLITTHGGPRFEKTLFHLKSELTK